MAELLFTSVEKHISLNHSSIKYSSRSNNELFLYSFLCMGAKTMDGLANSTINRFQNATETFLL